MPEKRTFVELCDAYLQSLASTLQNPNARHELSLRNILATFLNDAQTSFDLKGTLHHEMAEKGIGRPDFTLCQDTTEIPLGYIEAEGIDANLSRLTGHAKEQNERYRHNLDNFLLTNHLDFHLYAGGELVDKARLPDPEAKGFNLLGASEVQDLRRLLTRFFAAEADTLPALKNPEDLAKALARRTKQLNHEVLESLTAGSQHLQSIQKAFRQNLISQLDDKGFSDLYSQTLAYGMFAARVAKPVDDGQRFDRRHAAELVPESNPFLRQLFEYVSGNNLEERLRWIADDIARLLDKAPLISIRPREDKSGREDPVIHFYETFLKEYDPRLRELRGVYYTPQSVVSYIVRSVDKLLKSKFTDAQGKPRFPQGLADQAVKILDPATGTGTFLAEVIRHVYAQFKASNNLGAWTADLIENQLVSRLFAFELLVAPYTIAHLKLNLLLRDTCAGYRHGKKRLNIYLTNALEPPQPHPELPLAEFVTTENNMGADIKAKEDILVILGNPPYSGHSANQSKDAKGKLTPIGKLLHGQRMIDKDDKHTGVKADPARQPNYFECDGKPLGERNPKWLNDDYVKFIRFAQWRIDRTGEGVVGFITNHGYLDNPTFRGMRQALMQSFDELYVLDLHGNDRKKEKAPDGSRDENVFDIQQGVAILLAVKTTRTGKNSPCQVHHADLWGKRSLRSEGKYHWLFNHDVESTEWEHVKTDFKARNTNYYLYKPLSRSTSVEYLKGWGVKEMFTENNVGVVTARDSLTVHFNAQELKDTVRDFYARDAESARACYKLGDDAQEWAVAHAQKDLGDNISPNWESAISYNYRPFDNRKTYYTGESKGFHCRPRGKFFNCVPLGIKNKMLMVGRNAAVVDEEVWTLNFVTNQIVDFNMFYRGGVQVFPLYFGACNTRPNFSPEFLKVLAKKLGLPQVETPEPDNLPIVEMLPGERPTTGQYPGMPEGVSPEDVFHYAYAVFHCPTYRSRYAEFLKIDFPRLPLTRSLKLFRTLAALGAELTALHLLDSDGAPVLGEASRRHPYPVQGSSEVEKPTYRQKRVYISKDQYFDNVPQEVWEFRIGGYQPAEKWLKDRKGRTLTSEDIGHYQKLLVAQAETLRLMEAIDQAIPEWPLK